MIYLKELGSKLKETREGMDISLEEASEDLNLTIEELENLEDGNMKFFNDVGKIKMLLEHYGKYLGLNYENLIDDFNEYLFDYTSKLSISEIKKADKKQRKEEKNKIKSPYTTEDSDKKIYIAIGVIIFIAIVIMSLLYFNII